MNISHLLCIYHCNHDDDDDEQHVLTVYLTLLTRIYTPFNKLIMSI